MQNDLQLLIAELQQEHDLLQSELDKCLKDSDYKGARWHQKALGYTSEKLRILKNLENPHYSNIQELRLMIDRMKNLDATEIPPELIHIHKALNAQQISKLEDKLTHLESREKKYQLDSDAIETHLEGLLSGQAKQLIIEISRPAIRITFRSILKDLHITVTAEHSNNLDQYLPLLGTATLKELGFTLSSNAAVKEIKNFNKQDIPGVIQMLSILAFDVFGLHGNVTATLFAGKNT